MKYATTLIYLLAPAFTVAAIATTKDLSAAGKYQTSTLDFPELADPARDNRKTPMKVHLPVGSGPFPIVIISHGAAGNRDANFAQAIHLASHGYICVCLEHIGSNTERVIKGGLRIGQTVLAVTRDSEEVLSRPKDVSHAIDTVVRWNRTHSALRGKCDTARIGAMGHSFGAFTTLVVCGARPALDWMKPQVGTGRGLGPRLFDKRVLCGVALSPQGPGEPFFQPDSYRSLRVPILGITGSRDRQQVDRPPTHRKQSFRLWPPKDKYLLWIANASHTSFSDSTGSGRRNLFARGREDVQKVSRAATLLFFDKYLKKSKTLVKEELLQPYKTGIVTSIELLSK